MRDEAVPGFSRAHVEQDAALVVVAGASLDALNRNFQNEAGPAGIRDYEVAAASENKQRQILGACECDGFLHLGH